MVSKWKVLNDIDKNYKCNQKTINIYKKQLDI